MRVNSFVLHLSVPVASILSGKSYSASGARIKYQTKEMVSWIESKRTTKVRVHLMFDKRLVSPLFAFLLIRCLRRVFISKEPYTSCKPNAKTNRLNVQIPVEGSAVSINVFRNIMQMPNRITLHRSCPEAMTKGVFQYLKNTAIIAMVTTMPKTATDIEKMATGDPLPMITVVRFLHADLSSVGHLPSSHGKQLYSSFLYSYSSHPLQRLRQP